MHTLLLIIIILVALWLLWPIIWRMIRPTVQRYLARKTEDYIRRATGMPPRPKQEHRQKKETSESGAGSRDTRGEWFYDTGERRRRQQRNRSGREPLIPKEYAVDVEFVEILDYSSATVIGEDSSGQQQVYHESQVSDAEYVMIKPKHS